MYIPGPIYKFLPHLCILIGIAAFLFLDSVLAVVSSLILISLGGLIFYWRYTHSDYRKRVANQEKLEKLANRQPRARKF